MRVFTTYKGDKIEARRDGTLIALLAGVAWGSPNKGHLLFDQIYDYSKEPFDVVVNDSVVLTDIVVNHPHQPNTNITYEFQGQNEL